MRHDQIPAIESALGVRLDDWTPARTGQQRTFLASFGGEPVVVKWGLDRGLPEKIPYAAAQVPELRRRGIPVPIITHHGPIDAGGYAWMMSRLPGHPARVLSTSLLDQLLVHLDRCRDAPPQAHHHDLAAWVAVVIQNDAADYWATTGALGPPAQALCRRLRAWVDAVPPPPPRRDFVHIDLNLGNVLVDHGRISGIIDVENLGVGDRTVDVARLAFEWFWQNATGVTGLAADGLERLVDHGRRSGGEAGWRYAVTYDVISRLGWRSQHVQQLDPAALVGPSADFLRRVA